VLSKLWRVLLALGVLIKLWRVLLAHGVLNKLWRVLLAHGVLSKGLRIFCHSEGSLSQYHLSIRNVTLIGLRSNPGLCGEKPDTNRVSNVKALCTEINLLLI
jgi:hypothetical protein